jgi:hypothetical protein
METINAKVVTVNEAEAIAIELNKVRNEKKELARREKELVSKLYETGVIHENKESEEIHINNVVIRKIVALSGARYDVNGVRVLADSLKLSRKELVNREWKFAVNEDKLMELVKDGKVPQEVVDKLSITSNRIKIDVE